MKCDQHGDSGTDRQMAAVDEPRSRADAGSKALLEAVRKISVS
jgi:hypothetical protein